MVIEISDRNIKWIDRWVSIFIKDKLYYRLSLHNKYRGNPKRHRVTTAGDKWYACTLVLI